MIYTDTLETNEFILKLTEEQKIIFLKTLAYMAKIDGRLDEEEIKYIKDIAKKYQITRSAQIFDFKTETEILNEIRKLDNRRVYLELIKELCLLGHADNDLSDDEVLFIGNIGKTVGIELEKIEQISNWVVDKIIWLEQGRIIFEDD